MRIGRKRRGKREGDYGNDEEDERERDEEMRGRAADSGISRKVSAVLRRRVLGTDRFLDEPRQRNCESMAQSHCGFSYRSRFDPGTKKRVGMSTSPNFLQTLSRTCKNINI